MLNMVKGCEVPFPERLFEGYEMGTRYTRVNLHAERIPQAVRAFLERRRNEKVFFILELPTNREDEPEPERCLHRDIYYLDNLTPREALDLLEEWEELLTQDGMSAFGFGGQESGDEVMVEKYNLVTLWAVRPVKFQPILDGLGLPAVEKLTTAWDTFDQDHPGRTRLVTVNGMDVYALAEALKERGLYFAERRKDS